MGIEGFVDDFRRLTFGNIRADARGWDITSAKVFIGLFGHWVPVAAIDGRFGVGTRALIKSAAARASRVMCICGVHSADERYLTVEGPASVVLP